MADINFDKLLDEQRKTTGSLNRLGKTLREQLLGDESQEKDQRKVDAGNKAWQTRQTNIAKAGIKGEKTTAVVDEKQASFLERMRDQLNFIGKDIISRGREKLRSATRKKETAKDEKSHLSKMFGGLKKGFMMGIKGLGKVLGKVKDVAGTGFKAILVAAGFFLLIKFLQSEKWKEIREWLKKEGPQILEDMWENLKKIVTDLLELVVDVGGAIANVFGTITDPEAKWHEKILAIPLLFTQLAVALYNWFAANFGWEELGKEGDPIDKRTQDAKIAFQDAVFGTIEQIGINITTLWDDITKMLKDFFVGIPKTLKASLSRTWLGKLFGMEEEEFTPEEKRENKLQERKNELLRENNEAVAKARKEGKRIEFLSPQDAMDIAEKEMAYKEESAAEALALAEKEGNEGLAAQLKSMVKNRENLEKMEAVSSARFDAETATEEEKKGRAARSKDLKERIALSKIKEKEFGELSAASSRADKIEQERIVQANKDRNRALQEDEPLPAGPEGQKDAEMRARRKKYTPEMDKTTLDNRIAELEDKIDLVRRMGTVDGEMLGPAAENIRRLEQKKSELEAARAGGGGNVTNIAQNNSTNMNSSTTRAENISVLDPETVQVQAANI